MNLTDTIAAIATSPGAAGLAVVRLSGPSALPIAGAVFRGSVTLKAPSHTLHHGWVIAASGERVDEVVAAIFRAPRSYTREDVVELSCHGGRLSAAGVLDALLAAGARLARPGEFTLRAFLNGRLDLAQAEAVADVIHAETEAARSLALGQLAGDLSRRLDAISERITDLLAEIEARVDFAEDVGGVEIPPQTIAEIGAADAELAALLEGAAYGRALREGVRLPIVGRPNVGKSSLFNALIGEERAIVTPEAGTTRDRVSEPLEIQGVRVLISDTAGLRAEAGGVEAIGIARARETLAESPLAVWVVDGSAPLEREDHAVAALLAGAPSANVAPNSGTTPARRVVVALNKADRGTRLSAGDIGSLLGGVEHRAVTVSALSGAGVGDLRATLGEQLEHSRGASPPVVSNPRHAEALARSRAALARATRAAEEGAPGEILALELRESLAAIGEVTGRSIGDDLLDRIFSRFCIGK
jgi:tRNA modification GTPase